MFESKQSRPSARTAPRAVVEAMDPRQYCDADNSLGSAANLGTVSSYTLKSGNLTSNSDTKDFYKFTVPSGTKSFTVKLGGLGKNADLYLYNGSKTQIASSKNGGTTSEVLTKTLSGGTYYAEVRAKDNNSATTGYALKLTSDFTGNTAFNARNLGDLAANGSESHSEYVGSLDLNDYYQFSTTDTGKVTVKLDGLSADADLQLLTSNGTPIVLSDNGGTTTEQISLTLATGTYFARVLPHTASVDTKYTLTLSGPPADVGNTRATATTVTSPFTGVGQTIGKSDVYDFYKINVPDYSYVVMSLKTTDNPVTLAFYGEDGSYIDSASASVGHDANLSYFLHTGGVRYVAAVNSTNTIASYTISISTQEF